MKIHITDGKKYLAIFIIFSFFLCATLTALMALGIWSFRTPEEKEDTEYEEQSDISPAYDPIVIIDAGHGGEDGGTVGINGVLEKDINLSIALALDKTLRDMGVTTLLTRDEDILLYDKNSDYKGQKKAQDLAARRRIAEECECAIFVSIHMNSFPEEKYKGLQVYYSENDETSVNLARTIQEQVSKKLQPENTRQCKIGSDIYLLQRLSCPAVLVECGFLSNSEECMRLSDPIYQNELASVLSESILSYIRTHTPS